MKDFDLDNLKRENVFTTPDGFFEDMQNKVLQEVIPAPRGKIIKLNWAYAAAASVALIFGVTKFVNSDPREEQELITQTDSQQEALKSYSLNDDKPQKEEAVALQVLEEDLTSVAQVYQKQNAKQEVIANSKNSQTTVRTAAQNPEVQVDQILSSFTSAEMADIGRNTEQDIYLDLYN